MSNFDWFIWIYNLDIVGYILETPELFLSLTFNQFFINLFWSKTFLSLFVAVVYYTLLQE